MKKIRPNLLLGIGLLLYSITQIVKHYWGMPSIVHYALTLSALAFELWGVLLFARSTEMKNRN